MLFPSWEIRTVKNLPGAPGRGQHSQASGHSFYPNGLTPRRQITLYLFIFHLFHFSHSDHLYVCVTVAEVRIRKIRTALRANHIAESLPRPLEKKYTWRVRGLLSRLHLQLLFGKEPVDSNKQQKKSLGFTISPANWGLSFWNIHVLLVCLLHNFEVHRMNSNF